MVSTVLLKSMTRQTDFFLQDLGYVIKPLWDLRDRGTWDLNDSNFLSFVLDMLITIQKS